MDGSPALSLVPATEEQLPPRLPLGFEASSSSVMSPDNVADSAGDDAEVSHPLNDRDIELIDFLVQKAIEKCMPARPQPPLPPGVRAHPVKRKPQGGASSTMRPASAHNGAASHVTPSSATTPAVASGKAAESSSAQPAASGTSASSVKSAGKQ